MRKLDLKLIELRLLEIIDGLHKLGTVQHPRIFLSAYYVPKNEHVDIKLSEAEISNLYEQEYRIDQTSIIRTGNVGDIESVNDNDPGPGRIETNAIDHSNADIAVLSTGTIESRIIELETTSTVLNVTTEKILPSILKRLSDLAGIRN